MPRKPQPLDAQDQPPPRRFLHGPFVATLLGIAVLWGLRLVQHSQPSAADVFAPVAMSVVLAWWAIADSIVRQQPIPLGTRVWFVLLAGIVVPGYFIWTRGWRGVLWVALFSAAWYAACVASMVVGKMLAYGVGTGE